MGEPVFAVLSGITWITENLAVASYTTWNVILISISSLSCWSSHNHFLAGRFPHWNAIIWITCMSFIGWYINFWDLIEKNRLTWQVHTRLSPLWRQHDPTPPPHPLAPPPPCGCIRSEFRNHTPLVTTLICPTTSKVNLASQPSFQITGSLLSKGDTILTKEISVTVFSDVSFDSGKVEHHPLHPLTARQWNFDQNL